MASASGFQLVLEINVRRNGYQYKRGHSLQVARIANLGERNSRLPPPTLRFESFSRTVREIVFNRPPGLYEKLPQSRFPTVKNCQGGVQYVPEFLANRGSVPKLGYCSAPTCTTGEAEFRKDGSATTNAWCTPV